MGIGHDFYLLLKTTLNRRYRNALQVGMDSEKLPSAYVLVHRNCFMHRAITLFASASTYDHDEVFANLFHHCQCSQKIFSTPKVINSQLQNSNFLHHFGSFVGQHGLKQYETQKITTCLRFCV